MDEEAAEQRKKKHALEQANQATLSKPLHEPLRERTLSHASSLGLELARHAPELAPWGPHHVCAHMTPRRRDAPRRAGGAGKSWAGGWG